VFSATVRDCNQLTKVCRIVRGIGTSSSFNWMENAQSYSVFYPVCCVHLDRSVRSREQSLPQFGGLPGAAELPAR